MSYTSNFFPQTMRDNNFDTSPPLLESEFSLHDRPSVALIPTFSGDMFKTVVQFPVIVESWDRITYGRDKRRWHSEFTQAERITIRRWAKKFYLWHLVTGTPLRVQAQFATITLLQRAVGFFANL